MKEFLKNLFWWGFKINHDIVFIHFRLIEEVFWVSVDEFGYVWDNTRDVDVCEKAGSVKTYDWVFFAVKLITIFQKIRFEFGGIFDWKSADASKRFN